MTKKMKVEHIPSTMQLLPPAPGACQVCAVRHAPEQPHNPDSLYWQTARHMAGEELPTWEDALAHCPPEVREAWVAALREHGVEIGDEDG
jgi:hypothetical protein